MSEPTPRWLILHAEIDYAYWLLSQVGEKYNTMLAGRSAWDALIDEATGYEEALTSAMLAEAKPIIESIRSMRAEYDELASQGSQ